MMEDTIPITVSGPSTLAPHEVYRSKQRGPIKGAGERSKTDRNRLKRQLKTFRKAQHKQTEERARTLARLDPHKQVALDKRNALKTLSHHKNVTILKRSNTSK